MAKKQSLVGVCFAGVQKLVNSDAEDYCGMNEMLYLTWMGMAAKIQQRNEVMDRQTMKAVEYFKAKGVVCSVLKGQSIAQLYGDLKGLRQSGDVDIWMAGGRILLLNCRRLSLVRFLVLV